MKRFAGGTFSKAGPGVWPQAGLLFVCLWALLPAAAHGASVSGYSEYYIPGSEDSLNLVYNAIRNTTGNSSTHAVISVTAWSAQTTVYYDHWEDGYDFDPQDPLTADETVLLAERGENHAFESAGISLPRTAQPSL